MNSLGLGFIFVGVGISFSAYHLNRIIGKKPKIHYVFGAILGVLCINVGSNLIADGIRDRYTLA
jgi:small neutral amino acid transporter SnatA (MarC family)